MSYINYEPNFSIVVPGGCNAKCAFCFWESSVEPQDSSDYMRKLEHALEHIPTNFKSVSITGGEPTASPFFAAIIGALLRHRERFARIVLTTNGYKLSKFVDTIGGVVDFVNVSRHSANNSGNAKVFGTTTVPTVEALQETIGDLNLHGIQVTMSKVLSDKDTATGLARYIAMARVIGASGVFFRKPHGSLDPHKAEALFANYRATQSGCPVCIDRRQVISGMPVTWKRGLLEPVKEGFHEVVFQPSGSMTLDWAGRLPVTVADLVQILRREQPASATRGAPIAHSGGCGRANAPPYFGCGARLYAGGCGRGC